MPNLRRQSTLRRAVANSVDIVRNAAAQTSPPVTGMADRALQRLERHLSVVRAAAKCAAAWPAERAELAELAESAAARVNELRTRALDELLPV